MTSGSSVSQYQSGSYWTQNPSFHLEDSLFKARNVVEALQVCELSEGVRICDIGCGAGGVLHQLCNLLAERGTTVSAAHGYDISGEAIARGNALFSDVQLRQGSAGDVPGGYDVIIALDILEHLENYYEFLRAIRHKANFYVVHIPMEMTALRVLHQSELIETWDKVGHIHQFCEVTAIRVLNTAGFEIVHRHWTSVDIQQEAKAKQRYGYKRRTVNLVRKMLFPLVPSLTVALLGGKSLMIVAQDADTDTT